jgi:hypothetical protein
MSGAIEYKEAYRKGDYILNHYCRNSHKDKLCLSRSLHKWAIEYAKRATGTKVISKPAHNKPSAPCSQCDGFGVINGLGLSGEEFFPCPTCTASVHETL